MEQITFQHPLLAKTQTALQQCLFRELLRINLLLDDTLSAPQIYGKMAALSKKARYAVNAENELEKLAQLLHFFYQEEGFFSSAYHQLPHFTLSYSLEWKNGSPLTLGAILLQLASILNLPLYMMNFPTEALLRADITLANGRKEQRFIDLHNGNYLSYEQLEKRLEGEYSGAMLLPRKHLKAANNEELIERLETQVKIALTAEQKFEDVLKLIEYRLSEQPDNIYEIRDRGMILASLECYHVALDDLNYFIEQCPNDPSAFMLKLEMPYLEKQVKAHLIH